MQGEPSLRDYTQTLLRKAPSPTEAYPGSLGDKGPESFEQAFAQLTSTMRRTGHFDKLPEKQQLAKAMFRICLLPLVQRTFREGTYSWDNLRSWVAGMNGGFELAFKGMGLDPWQLPGQLAEDPCALVGSAIGEFFIGRMRGVKKYIEALRELVNKKPDLRLGRAFLDNSTLVLETMVQIAKRAERDTNFKKQVFPEMSTIAGDSISALQSIVQTSTPA